MVYSSKKSLFLYSNYMVSVTAGGPRSTRGHINPSSMVFFGWLVAFESIKIFRVKINWNVTVWIYYTIPFGFTLIWHF